MMLNLYDILNNVLSESINSNVVNDAIDNHYQVEIDYNEPNSTANGRRIIEPYVYGITPSGNEVIRAFQYSGDTKRGVPKWKLFRLDRITYWKPTNNKMNVNNYNLINNFNPNDMGMSNVINVIEFDNYNQQTKNNNTNRNAKNDNFNNSKSKIEQPNLQNNNINKAGPVMSKDLENTIDNKKDSFIDNNSDFNQNSFNYE